MSLSVREIQEQDIPHIVNYWCNASPGFMKDMGADHTLLPPSAQLEQRLRAQISTTYKDKVAYCIICLDNDQPVGHCNVDKIIFRKEAYMHLHLWDQSLRKSGIGLEMVKMAIPYFFENLQLETLFCHPYSFNPAPNRTLQKAGFRFVKEYFGIPGYLGFEQLVNVWEMTREDAQKLF